MATGGNAETQSLYNGDSLRILTSTNGPSISDSDFNSALASNQIPIPGGCVSPPLCLSRPITPRPCATATAESTLESIFNLLENIGALSSNTDQYDLFINSPSDPPVTKHMLKELDIPSLVNSLKLRWDINFSRDLVYRKLEDPERGLLNSSSNQYWSAIQLELELYALLPQILESGKYSPGIDRRNCLQVIQKRLPLLLKTIKDILQTILPKKDLADLDRLFDVRLMLQEIPQGCCEFPLIASRLAELLMKHCAPIRDQRLRNMIQLFRKGGFDSIKNGLSELLTVLELMRLDTANHLLRHFRWHFIESTTTFGTRYFGHRIVKGRFDAMPAKLWFLRNRSRFPKTPGRRPITRNAQLSAFVDAFTRHVLPSCKEHLPETFSMDAQRIQTIRTEMLEIIQLRLCYSVFLHTFQKMCAQSKKSSCPPWHAQKDIRHGMLVIARDTGSVLAASPDLAVYIVRKAMDFSGNAKKELDTAETDKIRDQLSERLDPKNDVNGVFGQEEARFQDALAEEVFQTADANLNSLPWEIYNKLVPTIPNIQRPPGFVSHGGDDFPSEEQQLHEITDRLAQMTLLHWSVFAPLIYLNDGLGGSDCAEAQTPTIRDETTISSSDVPSDKTSEQAS